MRLLLINPKAPESFWNFRWGLAAILPGKRAVNPPLGLATLAALCPPHWQVTIVDENVEPLPLAPAADLIGIAGMGVQFRRQSELLRYYRSRGYYVVAGGSFASLCPERYTELADSVICGEAEYIWPDFCRDFAERRALPLYRESGSVDLQISPVPRFDLLKLELYAAVTLQFSRGCPYLCEFCDIIVMFGRRPRHKTTEQIGRELDRLRELGVRNLFFVDDNLIGNRRKAKDLLLFLAQYQRRHRYDFSFGTEASLNLARDPQLMTLFREAHFGWVFIGIESPDENSLRETRKVQNVGEHPLLAVQRIYSYGIDILAGFIIGFDHDCAETFDLQYEFIMRSGIQAAMIGLLTALPRTPLHERLRLAGRLREQAHEGDNTKLATNVVPLGMSYQALLEGYKRLYARLLTDEAIARRIVNKHRLLRRPARGAHYGPIDRWRIVARLLKHGVFPGGPSRIYRFARSLPWRAPRNIPLAVADWIASLSMRDYVERHFGDRAPQPAAAWDTRVVRLSDTLARYDAGGRVSVSHRTCATGTPILTLSLGAWRNSRLCARLSRQLCALLVDTPSKLVLRIEAIGRADLPQVRRLLRRLARFGDRVSIELSEKLHDLISMDVWGFELVLPGAASQ
ncbi:MAG TPA: radical SAM protein [Steroidobacteraceae bacterium]|nr:radical SAM protein [Steroidobacteraceae bacterium]